MAFATPVQVVCGRTFDLKLSKSRCALRRKQSTNPRFVASVATTGSDELLYTLATSGDVRACVIDGGQLVARSAELHNTSAVATTALGRALLCALMLTTGKPDGETLQLQWRSEGPLGGVTAIATNSGTCVRGYVGNPQTTVPPSSDGVLNVAGAVGSGVLAVVRSNLYAKQPYTGLVRIVSGEIAQDVAHYLSDSEQIPSAISAGVKMADGAVQYAGGFLVQLLPFASEESIATLERNVKELPPVTELLGQGESASDIMGRLMRDLEPMPATRSEPRWSCGCSIDRLKRMVKLLPKEEVEDVLEKEKKIEATCEFCLTRYSLSSNEVRCLLAA